MLGRRKTIPHLRGHPMAAIMRETNVPQQDLLNIFEVPQKE